MTEDGGRRTDGRGLRTDGGGQRTEDRGQDGGQRTEDRGQRTKGQKGEIKCQEKLKVFGTWWFTKRHFPFNRKYLKSARVFQKKNYTL